MAFKIKIDRRKVAKVVEAAVMAAEQTTFAIKSDVEEAQVIPFETGDLSNSDVDRSRRKSGRFRIVHSRPYARRLYWHPEYNFRTDKNPNARGEWYEPWLTGDRKKFANESFKKLFRRQLKKRGLI
jgi:hypothetical protein